MISTSNQKYLMDTWIYVVDFGKRSYEDFTANIIMEQLYFDVDDCIIITQLMDPLI